MPVLKGEYDATVAYTRLDIVTNSGSSYVCLVDNTGQAVTNATYWQALAIKGGTGSTGATGPKGEKGDTGAVGPKGDTGIQGPIGKTGEKGDTGATGDVGPIGATGPTGKTGPTGAQGVPGDKGDTGARGATGADGKSAYDVWVAQGNTGDVATYLASLKGAKGDTGAQGPAGKAGATGPAGAKGDTGSAGTNGKDGARGLSIYYSPDDYGPEKTGSYWSDLVPCPTPANPPLVGDLFVNVSGNVFQITKVTPNAGGVAGGNAGGLFDYGKLLTTIKGPKGDTGATGATGPQGKQGIQGVAGPTGPAGKDGAVGATGAQGSFKFVDNRGKNLTPAQYASTYPKQIIQELHNASDFGLTLPSGQTSSLVTVETLVPWNDSTGGYAVQKAYPTQSARPFMLIRKGTSDTAWTAWETMTTW